MPRPRRFCPTGFPVHVIQRGHNRQICFTGDSDIATYAHFLEEGARKFKVSVHGWVFMTNHVHLLLTPQDDTAISKLMQYLGRLYVRRFNYNYSRSGGLFEDRFKSSLVQEEPYLITCLRYIELNPVRAGMVSDPGDYRWSSYRAHAFGDHPELWTPHELYIALGDTMEERQKTYRALTSQTIGADVLTNIRHCTNRGLILGTQKFREQFERLTGDQA
ncbi:MAG: transposase [Pseudomonadales bacterium]|nr:transposase [Pseudomonadales bacterium]